MSTTTNGQITKAKRELQKLREEYLRAADEAEQKKLADRIAWYKNLISQLGGV